MKKNVWIALLCLVVFAAALPFAFAEDEGAFDQLQNMDNTGETFDGSDGNRSGMDIDLETVEVPLPEPTPEPVEQ